MQCVVAHFEQLVGLVDEDRQQLVVLLVVDRFVHHRQGIDKLTGRLGLCLRDFDGVFLEIFSQRLETDSQVLWNFGQTPGCHQFVGHSLDGALPLPVERNDFVVERHSLRDSGFERFFHQSGELADSRDIRGARGAMNGMQRAVDFFAGNQLLDLLGMIKGGIYYAEVLFYLLLVNYQQFRIERQAGCCGRLLIPGLACLCPFSRHRAPCRTC